MPSFLRKICRSDEIETRTTCLNGYSLYECTRVTGPRHFGRLRIVDNQLTSCWRRKKPSCCCSQRGTCQHGRCCLTSSACTTYSLTSSLSRLWNTMEGPSWPWWARTVSQLRGAFSGLPAVSRVLTLFLSQRHALRCAESNVSHRQPQSVQNQRQDLHRPCWAHHRCTDNVFPPSTFYLFSYIHLR